MSMPTTDQPTPYTVHDGLAVYHFGSGDPVFLIPGPHRIEQPGDRMADALNEGLRRLGRQVITFNPPGSGKSTRPVRLGMPEMHQCTDEALEACEVSGSVDALGHSMGGLALLTYAIEQPRRVKRLMLVGTGSGGPAYTKASRALWNRSHLAFWRMALLGILHIAWARMAPERIMLNFVKRHSFHDRSLAEPEGVELRDWLRPRRGRTADWHRVARKLDYAPRLQEVEASTLILCGRYDPPFPPSCSEELAAGIRTARTVYFERSGHYPFIEEPEAFWAVVGAFLAPSRTPPA